MIDIRQFSVTPLDDDLHYQLKDPGTDETVATVTPVSVGEIYRESLLKRFLRPGRRGRFLPGLEYHVARIILRVSDGSDTTLFFIDRAAKTIGNACPPHYAAVAADGGVIGHATNDHYELLNEPVGPAEPDGTAVLNRRRQLCDNAHNVVCDIVARIPAPGAPAPPGPDVDHIRYVGQDGTLWARKTHGTPATEFAPDLPHRFRQLIITQAIGDEIDSRQQHALSFLPSSLPDPIFAAEPYPGHADIHSHYMEYQEEYVQWFKKKKGQLMR